VREMNKNEDDEEKFDYKEELEKQLDKDVWLQHLFNKLGREVVIETKTGTKIRGVLKTIEFVRGKINLEVESYDKIYFVNFRNVNFLEVGK
jgi:hypothetical protein